MKGLRQSCTRPLAADSQIATRFARVILAALGFKKDVGMTPEEVRRFCELKYPQLRAETRTNPDGYSFFLVNLAVARTPTESFAP